MPEQLTTKRKAEEPQHGPIDVPTTKKLRKASSQPALNSPPRPASAIDSSLSESPPPPSLTSGSSIEDSSSSTASSFVDKSYAIDFFLSESPPPPSLTSTSIKDSSTSTSMLQETRPNHDDAQGTKELSWQEFSAMSREELMAYGRLRGWKDSPDDELDSEYDPDNDPYQQVIYDFEERVHPAFENCEFEW